MKQMPAPLQQPVHIKGGVMQKLCASSPAFHVAGDARQGGSNGGLLMGAEVNQVPALPIANTHCMLT